MRRTVPRDRTRPAPRTWVPFTRRALLLGSGVLSACGDPLPEELLGAVPVRGEERTFDVASWNLEWFGARNQGPVDDALQLENVRTVVADTDADLWVFSELVSNRRFDQLVAGLPGYIGLVANAVEVPGGAEHYGGYDEPLQKVGILYRGRALTLIDARVILGAEAHAFAGRPPLAVKLQVTLDTGTRDVVVVALHAKCCSNEASWEQRIMASKALKAYLDETHPSDAVWVLGDFNDDLDESISAGHSSPYANFAVDTRSYAFPTWALTLAGVSTTADYPDVIDHHLVTDEANATYVPDSAQVLRVDRSVPDYVETTSDHFPVLSRYAW